MPFFAMEIFADTTVLYIRKSIKKVHPKWVNLVDVQKFTLSWLHTAQCTVLSVSLHTLYILGWVNMYQYLIFQRFHIKASSITSKIPQQANFRRSLQKSQAEIELCANYLALRCGKTIQVREPIFCSKVPMSKSFKI